MDIIIIGAGNVGMHISKALHKEGHRIIQVVSRSIDSARSLARYFNAEFTTDLSLTKKDADIYFITTTDSAIEDVASVIKVNNGIIVHTSGSTSINALAQSGDQYGVFYPLQTFSQHKTIQYTDIPIFIEGNNKQTQQKIMDLARSISGNVHVADSQRRMALHIAAVFSCNFVNHMFCISDIILKDYSLSFNYLQPLIKETFSKALAMEPGKAQTGPAVRNDNNIISKHVSFLKDDYFKTIYEDVTNSIKHHKLRDNKKID